MNQIKVNKTYKYKKTKNNMEKKLLISFLIISLISINTVFCEDVCRYIPGQTIFRCDDSMPSLVIVPGTEQNLTINCCVTGDSYNNNNTYKTNLDIINDESFGNQYIDENGTRIYETRVVKYNSSKWISAYYLPEDIKGFETFEVKITYKTPLYDSEYKASVILKSRFDLSINIPGKMIPKLAILPNIILPIDYKPLDYRIYVLIGIGAVALLILLIITFKSNKINQKLKRLLKKKNKSKIHQKSKDKKKK
jgi:hypothetical protein